MKKDIKLIVFDIDGTLVTDDKEILEENIDIIKKLRSKGLRIILNSGRTFGSMWPYREKLGLMGFDDYSICGTGAFIRRNADGKIIKSHPLTEDDYNHILKIIKDSDVQVSIHTSNALYLNEERPNESFLKDQKQVRLQWLKFEKFSDIPEDISRISIAAKSEVLDEFYDKYKEDLHKDFKTMRNEDIVLEILNKDSGKSEALKDLLNIVDIDKENVMYFGDGANDVKSLELAGVGVAMKDARDECKKVCDYVIGSNNEPSIANFLKQYLVI